MCRSWRSEKRIGGKGSGPGGSNKLGKAGDNEYSWAYR